VLSSLSNDFRRLGRVNNRPGTPAAYLVATGCVIVATLGRLAFAYLVKDVSPSILGLTAVFIGALLGGVRVGIFTVVLSILAAWLTFDSGYFDFSDPVLGLGRAINFSVYTVSTLITIFVAHSLSHAGAGDRRHVQIVPPPTKAERAREEGKAAVAAASWLDRLKQLGREGLASNSLAAYAFAVFCVAVATLLRSSLGQIDDNIRPFSCFYPAVLLVSLVGGLEAALVAMVLSAVVVGWAFYPPFFSFGPPTRGQIIDIGLYVFASLLTLWLAERFRRVVPHRRADQADKLSFFAPVVVSFGVVLLTTLILVAVEPYLGAQFLILGYLIPPAIVAILYGSKFAFFTSFACGLAAAYFLFPPLFSLYVRDPIHIVELVFFTIAALIVGQVLAIATFGVGREQHRRQHGDTSLLFHGNASRGRVGVLLIHSVGGSPLELRTVAEGLAARGLTVSCPQLAGHCGSEGDLLASGWPDWYRSAEKALDELARQCDVIVVGGLSVGSILALRLAALHPNKVHGLCLFAPTLRYDGWAIPWYSFLLMLGVRAPFLRRLRFADPLPYGIKDEATRAVVADTASIGPQFTFLGTLQESHWLVRDVVRRLASIKAPALIIHPREDDVSDLSNTIELQRRLGGLVQCVVLDDSYHLITIDRQRDVVMSRTGDFIAFIERYVAQDLRPSGRPKPSVVGGREYLSPTGSIPTS